MAGQGTRDPKRGSKTAPSRGFLCDFNIVGRLGPLHDAGHKVGLPARASGLLSNGSGPKKPRYSQCPPFSRMKVGTSSVGENTVFLNL